MTSDMIDGTNVPNVIWTLSFEIVFYSCCRRCSPFGCTGTARLRAGRGHRGHRLGGILPLSGLSQAIGNRRSRSRRHIAVHRPRARGQRRRVRARRAVPWPPRPGRICPCSTRAIRKWSGLTILALMYTGTMLYPPNRASSGASRRRHRGRGIRAGHRRSLAQHDWHMNAADQRQFDLQWIAAWYWRAGCSRWAWRPAPTVPRALAWLGLVSYSVTCCTRSC